MSWTRRDYKPEAKLTDIGNIRSNGARDLLVYCGNAPDCHHQARFKAEAWPDHVNPGSSAGWLAASAVTEALTSDRLGFAIRSE